jgi:hypothetical protein
MIFEQTPFDSHEACFSDLGLDWANKRTPLTACQPIAPPFEEGAILIPTAILL